MNEFITNGLINLFALFSLFVEDRSKSRNKVEVYLLLACGKQSANEYLKLYDELLDYYSSMVLENDQWIGSASNVIEKLKLKITHKEMVLLFLRLLELLTDSQNKNIITLIDDTAKLFSIEPELKEDLIAFINGSNLLSSSDNILLIAEENPDDFKNFFKRNIKGRLLVYHNTTLNTTVLRLIGDDELFIESRAIKSYTFQKFEYGDSISGKNIVPLSYSEIIKSISNIVLDKTIVFQSENLEYKFPNGNYGLRPFSFIESSGSMIAIMGGSGAGKTTLLNLLNCSLTPSKGYLNVNGYDLHSNAKEIEGLIGYVPQEDMLFEDLSVYQNLYYSAKLSFSEMCESKIREKVRRTLLQLELYSIKDLKVGNFLNKFVSGGQRKRLNIALELIREPAILLVDEPTSGLSSSDSDKVMQLLREQANNGKLIITNIHQPSSHIFRMFDSLWVLDKGGYIIFQGSPLDAITHFKKSAYYNNPDDRECSECGALNPELIFRIIEDKVIDSTGQMSNIRKVSPEEWYNIFKEKDRQNLDNNKQKSQSYFDIKKHRKPSKSKQFSIYFIRTLMVKLSNKPYILITLLQTPLLAIFVSYFTYYTGGKDYALISNKHFPIFIFMGVIVSLFSGMMASAEEIIKDRYILKRERFLNLSWGSYLNSKITLLFLISALQSFVFLIIANCILQIQDLFFLYWITLFSASCIANLIGLNLSNVLNSTSAVYIFIPVILIPQILLGGLIIEYDDILDEMKTDNNVPFIGNLAVSRWAYEAIAVGQYMYNDYNRDFFKFEKNYYNYTYYSNILLYETSNIVNKYKNSKKPLSESNKIRIQKVLNEIYSKFPVLKRKQLTFNAEELSQEIAFIREQFKYWRYKAEKQLDSAIINRKAMIGADSFEIQRRQLTNNALNDLVKKSNSTEFFLATGTNFVRLYAPIFKDPDSKYGGAHFYASTKVILDYNFETPIFNIIMIWVHGLVLYLLLIFNILRRLTRYA